MAKTTRSSRRAAVLASSAAVLGLLTACGNGGSSASPEHESGTAAPATENPSASGSPSGDASTAPDSAAPEDAGTSTVTASGKASSGSSTPKSDPGSGSGGRCHTSELSVSVGGNDPGAGQENFPVVLTNSSGATCTVRGFPGAAFVDGSGKQLGSDPERAAGSTAKTVTLKPGQSAWAGLTFSNPGISGAKTATPATLVVTPPDEEDPLKVPWKGGAVPVSGNSSSVRLTVFSAGSGA
ncbi:DUF4232 domain-containing protein [Streptomyces sp. NPDC008150]|uniref:DUF4232 domain-containing protein n=1 Tax=Streptomyces sp. NPDC008150 TaxID=3364816 RepID=UPI0036E73FE8